MMGSGTQNPPGQVARRDCDSDGTSSVGRQWAPPQDGLHAAKAFGSYTGGPVQGQVSVVLVVLTGTVVVEVVALVVGFSGAHTILANAGGTTSLQYQPLAVPPAPQRTRFCTSSVLRHCHLVVTVEQRAAAPRL
jgi:hypothetical protein